MTDATCSRCKQMYTQLLEIAQTFMLTDEHDHANVELMRRIEKLIEDYHNSRRTFRGESGEDFFESFNDYGTDEDSWQMKNQTTTSIRCNVEETNPGHGRARRESGEF